MILMKKKKIYCSFKEVHLKTSHNPCMTKGLINACNKKNNLYKQFNENRNEVNIVITTKNCINCTKCITCEDII